MSGHVFFFCLFILAVISVSLVVAFIVESALNYLEKRRIKKKK